jgi:hypothetical protein
MATLLAAMALPSLDPLRYEPAPYKMKYERSPKPEFTEEEKQTLETLQGKAKKAFVKQLKLKHSGI